MNIDEMPAGREMDALVAERVMGHTVGMADKAWSQEDWWTSDSPTERNTLAIDASHREGSGPYWLTIPAYSTDIAAAWLVVERMRQHIGTDANTWDYFVEALNIDYDYRISALMAHLTPLAICRAALKALT